MIRRTDRTEQHILFVDTEPFSLSGVHHLLRCDGFSVTTCSSMEEAVNAIERREYALVLIGKRLSSSDDGPKFGRYARERRPGTNVVLINDSAAESLRRTHNPDFFRCSMTFDNIQELYLKIMNKSLLSAGPET